MILTTRHDRNANDKHPYAAILKSVNMTREFCRKTYKTNKATGLRHYTIYVNLNPGDVFEYRNGENSINYYFYHPSEGRMYRLGRKNDQGLYTILKKYMQQYYNVQKLIERCREYCPGFSQISEHEI